MTAKKNTALTKIPSWMKSSKTCLGVRFLRSAPRSIFKMARTTCLTAPKAIFFSEASVSSLASNAVDCNWVSE